MTQAEFLEDVEDISSHRPMLWFALELTSISALPVLEFGAGFGSTEALRRYCESDGRQFISYENNLEWAEKHGSTYTDNWLDPRLYQKCSVVLIDQGPAEDRKYSIGLLQNDAHILVIHDAEEPGVSYRYDTIWHLFKYRIFTKGAVWTAAVSNHIDITTYDQTFIGPFKLEV